MKIREILETQDMAKPPTVEQLTSTTYFNELDRVSPSYAKMLQTAWEGDIREYNNTHGNSQNYLFPRMTRPEIYSVYAPGIKNLPVTRMLFDHMLELHRSIFGIHVTSNIGGGQLAHESMKHKSEYTILREEVKRLLGE